MRLRRGGLLGWRITNGWGGVIVGLEWIMRVQRTSGIIIPPTVGPVEIQSSWTMYFEKTSWETSNGNDPGGIAAARNERKGVWIMKRALNTL